MLGHKMGLSILWLDKENLADASLNKELLSFPEEELSL